MNVVLPCYIINEELLELTKNAIHSFGDVRLIIIDNGSPIGGGYLRSVADVYVRNKYNLGYAIAVNQGLNLSRDEYTAIANNDIRVSPNWQKVALDVLNKENVYSCHFRMIKYNEPFSYGKKIVYEGMERWCTSSFFVIHPIEHFLYDERYFNSYDDWDYWVTVRSHGYKTAYTDKACYQHNDSFTKRLMNWEIRDEENKEYFKSKWGKYPDDLYNKQFPDQMNTPYAEGFKL